MHAQDSQQVTHQDNSLAHLDSNAFLLALLFCLAHGSHLRVGVHNAGNSVVIYMAALATDVLYTCNAILLSLHSATKHLPTGVTAGSHLLQLSDSASAARTGTASVGTTRAECDQSRCPCVEHRPTVSLPAHGCTVSKSNLC